MNSTDFTSRTRSLLTKSWLWVLLVGIVLWVIQLLAYRLTQDVVLIPGILILGSATVPVACVIWFVSAEKRIDNDAIAIWRIALAFLCGGLVAIPFAAMLENGLLHNGEWFSLPGVALFEEVLKLIVLWAIAIGLGSYTRRQGMVLGAAVGFGFAAFETAGISLGTMIEDSSDKLFALEFTETIRSIEAPLGHGLWTALVGGALFAAAAGGSRLRVTRSVIGWLLVAVILHCLWDMTEGFAAVLAIFSTGNQVEWSYFYQGNILDSTSEEFALMTIYGLALKIVVMAVGAFIVIKQWKRDAPYRP